MPNLLSIKTEKKLFSERHLLKISLERDPIDRDREIPIELTGSFNFKNKFKRAFKCQTEFVVGKEEYPLDYLAFKFFSVSKNIYFSYSYSTLIEPTCVFKVFEIANNNTDFCVSLSKSNSKFIKFKDTILFRDEDRMLSNCSVIHYLNAENILRYKVRNFKPSLFETDDISILKRKFILDYLEENIDTETLRIDFRKVFSEEVSNEEILKIAIED